MASVEGCGMTDVEVAHKLGKVGLEGLDDQMKVIAHQDVGVKDNAVDLKRAAELLQERLAIGIVTINVSPIVAPAGDVVVGTRVLNP